MDEGQPLPVTERASPGPETAKPAEEGALFRYPLHPPAEPRTGDPPLVEFTRGLLRDLLSILRLRSEGREVEVEGFRFLGPDKAVHSIHVPPREGAEELEDSGMAGPSAPRPPLPGCRGEHPEGKGDLGAGSDAVPSPGKGRFPPGAVKGLLARKEISEAPVREGIQGLPPFLNRENAALYEPRLEFLARLLENLLSLVQLEAGGRPVEVDGFRLRRLSDWADAPVPSAQDVILHAADRCSCRCRFCYLRGSPPTLHYHPPFDPGDDWRRLEARIRHYRPRARRGLFPTFGGPREPFAHPQILPLLRSLRETTDEPLRLSTNGCALSPDLISELAKLAPLFLDLSLNSSDPARRSFLMGDPEPGRAISSLPRLAEAGIPFAVTVVAWPEPSLEEMLEDLGRTCLYAAGCGARMVQVNLPGYSRFFSPRPLFDTDEVWGAVVRRVRELRQDIPCPVVVSPALYEENLVRERKNLAEVIGVVPNSPAASWGLEPGDVILRLNGINVFNRPQARDLLTLLQESGKGRMSILVDRGGKRVELEGERSRCRYPFDFHTGTHLGVVFMGSGLRLSYLRDLEDLIRSSGARRVLFLTSRLVRPTLEQMLRERPLSLPEGVELHLSVPENRFFGGNIMLGDLLVVQDFIDHLREWRERKGFAPHLVVIPSSPFRLSGWGRDLTGRVYLDIARETGMRVELLECEAVMD
ncbi:radical SAM protein [Candidatus Solincola sp.]|nr:radical SAM protein [Actinomycetota bacterium]